MQYWVKHVVAAGLAVAVIGEGIAATQPAYADSVKDRRAEMKKVSKANKALKKESKAGDLAASKKAGDDYYCQRGQARQSVPQRNRSLRAGRKSHPRQIRKLVGLEHLQGKAWRPEKGSQ